MIPSFAPSTAARNQPMRWTMCTSECDRRLMLSFLATSWLGVRPTPVQETLPLPERYGAMQHVEDTVPSRAQND
jgi:hypothetical protein